MHLPTRGECKSTVCLLQSKIPNGLSLNHSQQTICARNIRSVIFLALARFSAYCDYPLYVLVFLSKAKNLQSFLSYRYINEIFPMDKLHDLHLLAGMIICVEVVWHSFWHLLRWGLAEEISFLWETYTGITGLITLSLTPLVAWPMCMPCCKKNCSFEVCVEAYMRASDHSLRCAPCVIAIA